MTRGVSCAGAGGLVAAPAECPGGLRATPANLMACNWNACPRYVFAAGEWSDCTATCGGGGLQHRAVQCRTHSHFDAGGRIVPDAVCREYFAAEAAGRTPESGTPAPPAPPPPHFQQCGDTPCSFYHYQVGLWGPCDAPCGGGTRARAVTCVLRDRPVAGALTRPFPI